ncbi:nSTAND1 domain-containing NTPase [Actinoallomurus rhizosphaericola]|uniref:nSTAND1 domain-containing NTPase n=1 Tax=Actinoallomurus rhizosphaericola TaxID=2952536 RepID=UPI0020931DCC|nr:trypsin-like peptidase domain-containing protein [Actinoallomurus rhizosphaericola]MCO5995019.1 trypsin-like peptidase domain-containing protein [Actinoallomurus rhizosphaericola]
MGRRPMDVGRVRAARFTPGLVRVLSADGAGIGLGLLIGEREIVTCAHVVNYSLDRDAMAPERPEVPIQLDFPFALPGRRFTAETVAWAPLAEDGRGDVAGLRLHGPAPEGARPSPMAPADDLFGHPFQVFGFLDGHETGVWVTGELRGSDIVGSLHLVGEAQSGLRISPGFSGSPVWDSRLEAVVGITSRAAVGRGAPPSAYCLSTETVVAAWPEIEPTLRPPCPFRGLEPYREADEGYLFGRTLPARRLAEELPRNRFSIVSGPSGCGKSSLMNAGVVPRLKRRPDLEVRVCRPGVSPLWALTEAIAPGLLGAGAETVATRDHDVLIRQAAARLEQTGRDRLVLVVDQAEELFAHPAETVQAAAGLLAELSAARRPDGRPLACVVLVVRGDYLDQFLELPTVVQALGQDRTDPGSGIRPVLPMNLPELRQSIEGPVRQARVVRMEDTLVDRLLRDVRHLSNPITLLAFAMTELWERQRLGVITLSGYEEINGVAGALRRHLDRVLDEELTEAERSQARSLLTSLAIPHGADGYVRRQLPRSGVKDEHWRLAQRLAGRRVITLDVAADGTETIELAHDALLEEWPRLRGWLDADREFLEWRAGLSLAMGQWAADADRRAGLLGGTRLEEADGWVERRRDDLTPAELAFVEQSHRAERRRRRFLFGGALAMTLILLAGSAFAGLWYRGALQARNTADAEAASANENRALTEGDPATALPSAVAGYRGATPFAALHARLFWDTATELVGWIRPFGYSESAGVVFSPDGRYSLADRRGDDVVLTRLDDPALTATVIAHGVSMAGRTFAPDGRFVVYADESGRLHFWEVAKRRETRRLPALGDRGQRITAIAVSPSGDAVAYARGGRIWIADSTTGKRLAAFPQPLDRAKEPEDLWFDATGRKVYTWGAHAVVFDRGSGKRRPISAVAYHPASGSTYVTCEDKQAKPGDDSQPPSTLDGVARLFDATSGEQIGPTRSLAAPCTSYIFAANATDLFVIATVGPSDVRGGAHLEVSDQKSGTVTGRFEVPDALAVVAVTDTPDGTQLLVQHFYSVYQLRIPRRESMVRALSTAGDALISADGERVATISQSDGVGVWDRTSRRRVAAIPPRDACAGKTQWPTVTASADGTLAALCGRRLTVMDIRSGRRIRTTTIGGAQGWSKDAEQHDSPHLGLATGGLLLLGWSGSATVLDVGTGRWGPLPVPRFFDTYGDWTPRPGHPQIAAARRDGRGIDILDLRRGGRLAATIPAPASTGRTAALDMVFDSTGRRLAVAGIADGGSGGGAAHIAVWDVDERKRLAGLTRSDPPALTALTRSGTTLAMSSGNGVLSLWRWGHSPIPFRSGDRTDRIPVPAFRLALSADGTHGLYDDEGWHLFDPDPNDWKRRLCGLIDEGRLTEPPARNVTGRPPCR